MTITRKSFIKSKKLRKIRCKGVNRGAPTLCPLRKKGPDALSPGVHMEASKGKIRNLIVCGCAVGAANSVFGGGGGMLAVPLLERTGLPSRKAHATAILVILPVSLLTFILYALRGIYDFSVLVPTAIGVTVGGFIGAKLLGRLPQKAVGIVFACLQAFAGAWLFFFGR